MMPEDRLANVPEHHHHYFESGVLDPEKHLRIVGDIKAIAEHAGIPEVSIYTPFMNFCTEEERDWLIAFNRLEMNENGGMVYSGNCADVGVRLFTVAGALIRNFISPKVMTVQEVIDIYKKGGEVSEAVLLIPNFYLGKKGGGDIPTWQSSMLMGMLLSRYAAGKKTLLYVSSMADLEVDYGTQFVSHLKAHFKFIKK